MLRKYETILIVKPDLPEEEMVVVHKRALAAIVDNGGHEIAYQDWGKKKLAYPIRKSPKGNYLYFRYLSSGYAVSELERNLKVLDPVLRYLTVKLEDRVDPESFDFEEERKGIFPFNVKPREVPEVTESDEGEDGDEKKKTDDDAPAPKAKAQVEESGDGDDDTDQSAE